MASKADLSFLIPLLTSELIKIKLKITKKRLAVKT